jgi:predicted Zn-dependent protease
VKPESRTSFDEAVKLHEAGQLDRAREELLRLSGEDSGSAAIYATLGHVCWDMRRFGEAVTVFKHAVRLSPKFEGASLGLFHCLWEIGKHDEAMDELKRFQLVSDSKEYRQIVEQINEKW